MQECWIVDDTACQTVIEQECSTSYEQECTTEEEQQCNTVNEQLCQVRQRNLESGLGFLIDNFRVTYSGHINMNCHNIYNSLLQTLTDQECTTVNRLQRSVTLSTIFAARAFLMSNVRLLRMRSVKKVKKRNVQTQKLCVIQ